MRPRNCLISFGVLGGSIFWILLSFSGKGVMPPPYTICPRYWICLFRKLHLTSLSFKSAPVSLSNRSHKCFRCEVISGLKSKMSSKQPKAKVKPERTSFTNFWKWAGACANPKGHLLNSHLPYEETKAVFGPDSFDRTIW